MYKTFLSIGALLGSGLAYYFNHSVLWAIVGFFFGWLYVLVAVCKHLL